MSNTYTQIHIHAIFAVKFRQAMIHDRWKSHLYKYITGIFQQKGHKMISINGMPDHVHILFGLRPTQSISDLMKAVKGDSSEWINQQRVTATKFRWQEGFSAFSYDRSKIPIIAAYIDNQEEAHRTKTFLTEYRSIMKKAGVEYDERYIFTEPI